MTQEQLAERIDRTPDAISQIERGINLPGFDTLERLSETLDIPVSAFFEGLAGAGQGDRHRENLLAELSASITSLSDRDLERLLNVVRAFWETQDPSAST